MSFTNKSLNSHFFAIFWVSFFFFKYKEAKVGNVSQPDWHTPRECTAYQLGWSSEHHHSNKIPNIINRKRKKLQRVQTIQRWKKINTKSKNRKNSCRIYPRYNVASLKNPEKKSTRRKRVYDQGVTKCSWTYTKAEKPCLDREGSEYCPGHLNHQT